MNNITLGEQRRLREYTDSLIQESIRVTGSGYNDRSSSSCSNASLNNNDALTLALRSGFERGLHSSVHDSLLEAKKRKENDINKVCSRHYSDFLASVNDMLKLKTSSNNLRSLVQDLHGDVSKTGTGLVSALSELENVSKNKEGTLRVMAALDTCKEMSERMLKCRKQIERSGKVVRFRESTYDIEFDDGEVKEMVPEIMIRARDGNSNTTKKEIRFEEGSKVEARSDDGKTAIGKIVKVNNDKSTGTRSFDVAFDDDLRVGVKIPESHVRLIVMAIDHYAAIASLVVMQKELLLLRSHSQLNPLLVCLQTWLPICKGRLLDQIRFEADIQLNHLRFEQSRVIGETLLRRKAKLVISENKLNVSLTKLHRKNRVKITKLSSTSSSISVETCENFMKFSCWCSEDEFDCAIPNNYLVGPSQEGSDLIKSLQQRLAPLFKSTYFHLALYESTAFTKEYRLARDKVLSVYYEEAESNSQLMGFSTVLPSLIAKIAGFFFLETFVRVYGNFSSTLHTIASSDNSTNHDSSNGNGHGISSATGHNDHKGARGGNHTNIDAPAKANTHTRGGSLREPDSDTHQGLSAKEKDTTAFEAFSPNDISSLWDKNVSYLYTIVTRNSDSFTYPEQILQLKEDILLLIEVANDVFFQGNLKSSGLYDVLRMIWPNFERSQNEYLNENFKMILEDCDYRSLVVTSEEVFNRDLKTFNLHKSQSMDGSSSMTDANTDTSIQRRQIMTETLDSLEDDLMMETNFQLATSDTSSTFTKSSNSNNSSNNNNNINNSSSSSTSSHDSSVLSRFNNRNSSSDLKGIDKAFLSQVFPFSEAVPKIFKQVFLMVTRYLLFAAKNTLLGSRGESICNSVKVAFTAASSIFQNELMRDGVETPLSKAVQVSIDCMTISNHMSTISQLMEKLLSHLHWFDSVNTHLPACLMASKSALINVSLNAQDVIVELLSSKINDLLDSLCFIDFIPQNFQERRAIDPNMNILTVMSIIQSHEVIDQIIDYLQVTFMTLTHLPSQARAAVHFTCCSKISQDIINFVTTPAVISSTFGMEQAAKGKVKEVNILSLIALEKDVTKLELFADSCGTPHLRQCFSDMRDLVQASIRVVKLHIPNPSELYPMIDDPYLRSSMYPKLDLEKLAMMIDKISPTTQACPFNNILPRIDKSNLKSISKKIRSRR